MLPPHAAINRLERGSECRAGALRAPACEQRSGRAVARSRGCRAAIRRGISARVRMSIRRGAGGLRAVLDGYARRHPAEAIHPALLPGCARSSARCGVRWRSPAAAAARNELIELRRPRRPSHRTGAAQPARSRPAKLAYRPLFTLSAPLRDPASARLAAAASCCSADSTPPTRSTAGIELANLRGVAAQHALPLAQHDAQGAALGGRVYVFGGGSFSELDHIISFDPRIAAAVQPSGALPQRAVRRRGRRDRRHGVHRRRLRRHELVQHDPRLAPGRAGPGRRRGCPTACATRRSAPSTAAAGDRRIDADRRERRDL